ncbi:MAG TPA: aldehyde dehydrogenase family protein [Bryobacteraceae bacterium]|jgi:acyl-CoA reductase-like NAD-dependent aldehyde dehydrogenase
MTAQEAVRHLPPPRHFIGGEYVDGNSPVSIEVHNPATGELLAAIPDAASEDVNRAVQAARASFENESWRGKNPSEKERILLRVADLMEQHKEELAAIEALENGKTFREAVRGDINPGIDAFRYYAGSIRRIYGETIPVDGAFLNYTLREPVGVVGAIVPWNYPTCIATWKIAPALACGCSVILKPSELTPFTALKLAQICMEAGIPEGAMNVVTGYGTTTGDALARHMDVDKISFTGSIRTARSLLKASAESNLKRLSLELGGKNPNIIFPDCDFDQAVEAAFWGIYANKGEVCSAGSRLLVHASVHDQFVEKLVDRARNMNVGDPFDPASEMGAQISAQQLERILGYVQNGQSEGARLRCGGERDTAGAKANGYFMQPAIFTDVRPQMKIAQEEIFGPVLTAIRFEDEQEAAQIANGTIYGLVSAVWTRDIRVAHRMASRLKAGSVWINTYNGFDSASPFGGYKQSGYGRDLGAYALEQYTNVKSVWVSL